MLQFALGFFTFLDAAVFSKVANGTSTVHVTFVDWIPLICSVLGMLVINSIEKARLSASPYSGGYSGDSVAWKAWLVLFMSFALIAGGLAGSVTVLVLKYIVPGHPWPTMWFGVANAVSNALIMLSCCTLWVTQSVQDD